MGLNNNITFDVKGAAAADLIRRFLLASVKANAAVKGGPAAVTVATNLCSDNLNLKSTGGELPDPAEAIVKRVTSDAFERVVRLNCKWVHGGNQAMCEISLAPKSGHFAYQIDIVQNRSQGKEYEGIVAAFRSHFEAIDYTFERFQGLPEELAEFHRQQSKLFAEEKAELLQGHERLRDAIVEAEQRAQDRIKEAQESFAAKEAELDKAHQVRSKALEEDEERLNQKKKDLDDRERMHVRREHQKNLSAILQKHRSFSHSPRTNRKRWPIHAVCLVAMAAGATLYAIGMGWTASLDDAGVHIATTRNLSLTITGALVFGSTLVYYLRWLNAWFRSHAQAEIAVQALDEDFTRAAWLVELLFEWSKDNQASPFPPEVLSSLSRGLFSVSRETDMQPDHPMAELIAHLPNVREVSQDKKGFRVKVAGSSSEAQSPSAG